MKFSKEEKKQFIKRVVCILAAIIPILIFDGNYMGSDDFGNLLIWWFVLFLISLSFLPVALVAFRKFHDNGWIFGKTIGIAVSGWFVWYLSNFKILKFTQFSCVLSLLICTIVNFGLFYLLNHKKIIKIDFYETFSLDKIGAMLVSEAFFFGVFAIYSYIKGYNPSAYGIEKFMDYGFLTAMLKSDYMPPHDMWLSGNNINYYYVGQYLCAYLIRLVGTGAGYGYNLSLMTLPAATFTAAFSLVYNIIRNLCKNRKFDENKEKTVSRFAGLLAGTAVTFAGNMHFPVYKWIVPKLKMIRDEEAPAAYWFADATRYIGYNPVVDDKTVTEFPGYAYVLGDLHAHVINAIFVLTVLSLLYSWMLEREALIEKNISTKSIEKVNWLKEIFAPQIFFCMFFIGLFHMTNYWDFPIYFVVCGAIILFTNLKTFRYKKESWILTALQALAYVIVWVLVSLPFTLNFDSIATYVRFVDRHSLFYQLLVLWGLPASLVVIMLVRQIVKAIKKKEGHFFPKFFDLMESGELYTVTIGVCAMGLVLLPELIYVADIYGGTFQRTNTMFKLSYQAYIMFDIAMSVIIIYLLFFDVSKYLKKVGIVALILFMCTVCYAFEAFNTWFTGYYKTLDASEFLEDESYDDYEGIEWINENVSDDATVLEMCGLSYTFFNRVSVFTGNSTVLGWQSHEWLWRSSGDKEYPELVTERRNDIITLYTSQDMAEVKSLIDKYDIDYIYVGEAEHFDGYYGMDEAAVESGEAGYYHGGIYKKIATNEELLKQLGKVHMISEPDEEKEYATYIIEVAK